MTFDWWRDEMPTEAVRRIRSKVTPQHYKARPIGYDYAIEARLLVAFCRVALMQRLADQEQHTTVRWDCLLREYAPADYEIVSGPNMMDQTVDDEFFRYTPHLIYLEDNDWIRFASQFLYVVKDRTIALFRVVAMNDLERAFGFSMKLDDDNWRAERQGIMTR